MHIDLTLDNCMMEEDNPLVIDVDSCKRSRARLRYLSLQLLQQLNHSLLFAGTISSVLCYPITSSGRKQHRLTAASRRSGVSRAVMFQAKDLPPDKALWAATCIFRGVLVSRDSVYDRQLDLLGGGFSRGPSTVAEADIDYIIVAVGAHEDGSGYNTVPYGNLSAAVGRAFAVDSGLVTHGVPTSRDKDMVVVRIHNTNTGNTYRPCS